MKLERATIEQIHPAGDKIEALFNPKEYRISKANVFTEVAVPGLNSPPLQFGRGNARTLSMQLFFDTYTYKGGKNVQDYTDKITNLLQINSELHAPPICRVTWGKNEKLKFIGVLERSEQRFTLFLPNGTPVRATVDVTFKEFVDDQLNLQSANFVKQHVVHRGDTLSAIAAKYYGDAAIWRPIALENDISDPLALTPGHVLTIPAID
jgi:nucleoid-associated protein YgaU